MKGISAFAFFCEDIRRESANRDTLIGVMPENIQVTSFPGALRRLAVYFRIRLDVKGTYKKSLSVDLEIPGDDVQIENRVQDPVPLTVIEQSINRSKERGLPYATIIGRMALTEPIPVPSARVIKAILHYGKESQVCGLLNVIERPKDASTASPLPPSQSEPAAPET
jgi:hypothetical protein